METKVNKLTGYDFEKKMMSEYISFGQYFFDRLYNKNLGSISSDPVSKLHMHKKMRQKNY